VQRAQADKYNVDVIDMQSWYRGRRPEFSGPVYISLDMDGFDPGFAPAFHIVSPAALAARGD